MHERYSYNKSKVQTIYQELLSNFFKNSNNSSLKEKAFNNYRESLDEILKMIDDDTYKMDSWDRRIKGIHYSLKSIPMDSPQDRKRILKLYNTLQIYNSSAKDVAGEDLEKLTNKWKNYAKNYIKNKKEKEQYEMIYEDLKYMVKYPKSLIKKYNDELDEDNEYFDELVNKTIKECEDYSNIIIKEGKSDLADMKKEISLFDIKKVYKPKESPKIENNYDSGPS